MAFDVASRLFVLLLIVLIAGVLYVFGAGAQLVTALCIAALGFAPLIFVGLQTRRLSSPLPEASRLDLSGDSQPD